MPDVKDISSIVNELGNAVTESSILSSIGNIKALADAEKVICIVVKRQSFFICPFLNVFIRGVVSSFSVFCVVRCN